MGWLELVEQGLGRTVNGLDERIRWWADRITVRATAGGSTELAGQGLLLMPTAFGWPRVIAVEDGGWPPVVAYPARGIAAPWSAANPVPDALGRLLRRNRAAVLAALDVRYRRTAAGTTLLRAGEPAQRPPNRA